MNAQQLHTSIQKTQGKKTNKNKAQLLVTWKKKDKNK